MHSYYILFSGLFLYTISAQIVCPPGTFSTPNSSKCYKYLSSPLSFYDAEATCNKNFTFNNGHLASIRNAFDNAFIAQYITDINGGYFWIGANSLGLNWGWTDGSSFNYTNWASGQPSNGYCAYVSYADGTWIADNCLDNVSYLCEFDPIGNC